MSDTPKREKKDRERLHLFLNQNSCSLVPWKEEKNQEYIIERSVVNTLSLQKVPNARDC